MSNLAIFKFTQSAHLHVTLPFGFVWIRNYPSASQWTGLKTELNAIITHRSAHKYIIYIKKAESEIVTDSLRPPFQMVAGYIFIRAKISRWCQTLTVVVLFAAVCTFVSSSGRRKKHCSAEWKLQSSIGMETTHHTSLCPYVWQQRTNNVLCVWWCGGSPCSCLSNAHMHAPAVHTFTAHLTEVQVNGWRNGLKLALADNHTVQR